jgi:hypothetical protein
MMGEGKCRHYLVLESARLRLISRLACSSNPAKTPRAQASHPNLAQRRMIQTTKVRLLFLQEARRIL